MVTSGSSSQRALGKKAGLGKRGKVHQPRFRRRKSVNVAALVAPPEEQPSRPLLRLQVMGMIVALLFGVMVLRLWTLQVLHTRSYAAAVVANGVRTVSLPAPRGQIVDRFGTVLVGNKVTQQIVVSRVQAIQHPSVIGQVAALIGETPAQVEAAIKNPRYSPFQPVPVLTNAPQATVQFLQAHQSLYPGVSVESVTQRYYPQGGTTATHVLGYVGPINGSELAAHRNQGYTVASQIGKTGIEAQYQNYLRGVHGTQEVEVNAQGQVVGTLKKTPPIPGNTVVLHLDTGLQKVTQSALANVMAVDRKTVDPLNGKYPAANTGAAIVMNVNTGAILAMASSPTYNLNQWIGGISVANYAAIQAKGAENNYAIDGLYTPGSSFKLATATAALQRNIIGPYQYYNDPGTFTVPNCTGMCTFHDASPSDAGMIQMPLALAESDDDYFYNLGFQFWIQRSTQGIQPIQNTAEKYGLGKLTGIDLPGEIAGRIDSPALRQLLHKMNPTAFPNSGWYVGDNMEMAFGQGETVVTPIEMADAYATFANGGTRYQPQVAAAVVTPGGKVLKRFAPKVLGHVNLAPIDYQAMLQGFEGTVANPRGTAYGTFHQDARFKLSQFKIAGKTGTADTTSGALLQPDAWFVAFGPIPNPEYVVLAVVGQGGYGDAAAAPAVMSIFNYLVTNPIPQGVRIPTPSNPPSTTPPPTNPPAGTPTTTTTTTTTTTRAKSSSGATGGSTTTTTAANAGNAAG